MFEKDEAEKAKKGGKKKRVRARAGPKGFGQKLSLVIHLLVCRTPLILFGMFTPPVNCNLKMSGNEDHHRQGRRFAARGNRHDERDPRDVEIERLRQRVRELEINPFQIDTKDQ
ncbi:hypothetical protein Tco_1440257 [Tanacetum coccineum]